MTLAQQVLDLIATPFQTVVGWFYSLLGGAGMLGFFTGTLIFVLLCSIILVPLRGGNFNVSGGLKSTSSLIKDASDPQSRFNRSSRESSRIGRRNRK